MREAPLSATDIEFDDPESSQDYLAYLASSRFEAAPVPYEQFREEWLAFLAVSGLQKEYLAKQNQVTREVSAFAASTADLTPINIGRYVRSLESRQLRRASIVTMLACLHSACSFAINRRYIAAGNPVDAKTSLLGWVRRGYSGRPAPDSHSTLEDAMVAELLSHLHRRSDSWEGHRLYALVATGLCTGFRRTALLTIRLEDVDLAAGVIRTSAKPFRIFDDQFRAVLSAWSPRSGCEWSQASRRWGHGPGEL
jgi:integrase